MVTSDQFGATLSEEAGANLPFLELEPCHESEKELPPKRVRSRPDIVPGRSDDHLPAHALEDRPANLSEDERDMMSLIMKGGKFALYDCVIEYAQCYVTLMEEDKVFDRLMKLEWTAKPSNTDRGATEDASEIRSL
ncbi:hypothetical protein R1sor_009792 [Riccia sorocarpa]|uniref:Uncharacterized protein n=1 Tax=Riccia sorocarpa TaxID=122646 RepID=A0ABD3HXK9_9MARC